MDMVVMVAMVATAMVVMATVDSHLMDDFHLIRVSVDKSL